MDSDDCVLKRLMTVGRKASHRISIVRIIKKIYEHETRMTALSVNICVIWLNQFRNDESKSKRINDILWIVVWCPFYCCYYYICVSVDRLNWLCVRSRRLKTEENIMTMEIWSNQMICYLVFIHFYCCCHRCNAVWLSLPVHYVLQHRWLVFTISPVVNISLYCSNKKSRLELLLPRVHIHINIDIHDNFDDDCCWDDDGSNDNGERIEQKISNYVCLFTFMTMS